MSLSQRLLLDISGQEEAEHTDYKSEEKNPLSVLKPQTPQCVGLLNILPTADLLSSQNWSLNKWEVYVLSQNTESGWIPPAGFYTWFAG